MLFRQQVGQDPARGGYQGFQVGALVIVRGIHPRADQRHRHIAAGAPVGLAVRAVVGVDIHLVGDGFGLGQLAQARGSARDGTARPNL